VDSDREPRSAVPAGGPDLAAAARAIIDGSRYLTLATADGDGRPWPTPVWFAHDGYREFLWVSRPDARHSRNLAVRAQVGIVIFDSTAAVGDAQAVYLEAVAEEVDGVLRERAIATYSRRSRADGAAEWSAADVTPPASHRLYRATAFAQFALQANDRRAPITLGEERSPAEPA
jgi:uncharacterized protein YhbP (UPF0306 family)